MSSVLLNLKIFDPFADVGETHVRVFQRGGRKYITTVEGLPGEHDLKDILRKCKKDFACNGTIVKHPEHGNVLQLQGDQRKNICDWLLKRKIVQLRQLQVHGF